MDKANEMAKKGGYQIPTVRGRMSWASVFQKTITLVTAGQPVILFGPPGTGKTKMALDVREELSKSNLLGKFEIIQFHKKFSYEDFIEGYVPSKNGLFEQRDGIFKTFCKGAVKGRVNLFVIDEFNRAELTTTLGETLFLIEDRTERTVHTAHFHEEFTMPTEVSILGTMNTADRNIAKIDYALRRRFNFLPLFPDSDQLRVWLNTIGFGISLFSIADYVTCFEKINRRISRHPLMGHYMQLGQSMFVPRGVKGPISPEDLVDNFEQNIIPQVEAYCGYGNERELQCIFNPLVAEKYLSTDAITTEDLAALINEIKNEK